MVKLNNLQEYKGKGIYTFTKWAKIKLRLYNRFYLQYHCKRELKKLGNQLTYIYNGKA